MNIKLFELDPMTMMVRLDKEWISTIKEFKVILKRDKGVPTQGAGRVKHQAMKEFTFIYHYCDYRSQFVDYSDSERLKESIRNAELPTDFVLFNDAALTEAVKTYLALQDNVSLRYLNELKETLHTGRKVIQKIRKSLENKLDNMDIDEMQEVEGERGRKIKVDPIEELARRLDIVMNFATKIPAQLERLKLLEIQAQKELAGARSIKGDSPMGYNEEPGSTTVGEALPNPMDYVGDKDDRTPGSDKKTKIEEDDNDWA